MNIKLLSILSENMRQTPTTETGYEFGRNQTSRKQDEIVSVSSSHVQKPALGARHGQTTQCRNNAVG